MVFSLVRMDIVVYHYLLHVQAEEAVMQETSESVVR